MKKIKGFIFDMDGLLVDTEKLYNRFWRQAAEDYGYRMDAETALSIMSMDKNFASKKLKGLFGEDFPFDHVKDHRRVIMQDFVDKEGVELKKGAKELLAYLTEHGYRKAIATMSPMERVENYLKDFGILERFDAFVCGPDVKIGKPEPDIYLKAAEKLGVLPEECMALEDSPNGILAAYRAGCRPVMIPDMKEPEEETRKLLYSRVDSLDQVIGLIEK